MAVRLLKLWADKGYQEDLEAWLYNEWNTQLEIVCREAGQKGFAVQPRRWVVEITIISKVGILYIRLERSDQKDILRHMIERVVVNPEGMISRLELLPPFSYLRHVTVRVQNSGGSAVEGKTKTSAQAGQCSDYVHAGGQYRTRTCDLLDVNETL